MFIWIPWDHAASILKGEIQVRISRIQASIEATSLNIRAYTMFPAPEKQFRANWGLCYRCPTSTSRMMRENIRSTIPAYWYVKLIDTCVIVIDPNFMIKFHRISLTNISIRYQKFFSVAIIENLWIPCDINFLRNIFISWSFKNFTF